MTLIYFPKEREGFLGLLNRFAAEVVRVQLPRFETIALDDFNNELLLLPVHSASTSGDVRSRGASAGTMTDDARSTAPQAYRDRPRQPVRVGASGSGFLSFSSDVEQAFRFRGRNL